jgi:hypothetical protein
MTFRAAGWTGIEGCPRVYAMWMMEHSTRGSIRVVVGRPSGFAVLLVALISAGCGGQDTGETPAGSSQVPPFPPDTVPASFDEDAVFVSDGSISRVSTTMLVVSFANGATLAEKQEAVDLIAGRVIGGVAIAQGGVYYVQVEGDSTIATIDSIAAVLGALPMIASAYPERILPIGW